MNQSDKKPSPASAAWRQLLDQLHELLGQATELAEREDYDLIGPVLDRMAAIFPKVARLPQSISQDDSRQLNKVMAMHAALIDGLSRRKDQVGAALAKITQGKQMLSAYLRNKKPV
ncbi:MAG: hypothetical protein HZA50_07345 [Planctomycetes bacterium]|nr:hypothetical protein [Planctomycetota bacterium]